MKSEIKRAGCALACVTYNDDFAGNKSFPNNEEYKSSQLCSQSSPPSQKKKQSRQSDIEPMRTTIDGNLAHVAFRVVEGM